MKTITLGKTGIQVRQLGFGAMYIPRISKGESDRIIRRALEKGINYFDTASAYQDSEEKLGRVLSTVKRSDFTILSRSHSWKMGFDAFKKDFEQSFERLQLETIDFYGFHAVNQPPELSAVMKEPLTFLKHEQKKSRIRHIAITGHNPVTMTEAVKTAEFALSMFPFNVIEQEPLQTLIDTANRLGIATSVMKPLAGGMIENKPFALRFFLSYPIGVITPGMSSVTEVDDNSRVFEEGKPLSAEELMQLGEEVAELGKDFCRRCSYCMPCDKGIMITFVHTIHLMAYGRELNDNIAYTLEMAKRMLSQLKLCDACGKCVEKCPYHLPTPKRIKELCEMLKGGMPPAP